MFQNNRKKMFLIAGMICIIGLVGIGISYAYWKFTYTQTDKNVAISKCLKLEMSNESNTINLDNMYPISDEEGKKLTPYSFKITNTCSISAEYSLNLEMLEGTTLNSKYLATFINNGDIKLLSNYNATKTTISGSVESRTLDTSVLTPGASKEYSISLWMDKSVTLADDAQNKSFSAKVIIDAFMYTGIVDKIVTQLDTTGKCPALNDDGTINVTNVESENSLLCSAPDNYGTSYYYRGNVTNNYVKFADKYWRIVRINGDGSIRMIYDGTSAHENGEASDDRIIGKSAFNEKYDDNAYVGYMYGYNDSIIESTEYISSIYFTNTNNYYIAKEYTFDESSKRFTLKDPIKILGCDITSDYVGYYFTSDPTSPALSVNSLRKIMNITVKDNNIIIYFGSVINGASSKEITQTNMNDSAIKKYLDTWYENNIKGTKYEKYLADNLFCNDRSFDSGNKGTGTNNSETYYRWNNYFAYRNTTLNCYQQNDAFTVNDTKNGNGNLTYPIGLITTDEAVLAGGLYENSNYYLYSGLNYWTSTAFVYNGGAYEKIIGSDGNSFMTGSHAVVEATSVGVRPVLSLSLDALKLGSGTMDDPFVVDTNN